MLRNHLFTDSSDSRRLVDPPQAHLLDAVGGLIGGIAVAAGAAGKGGAKEHKKAAQVWEKLQLSNFDFRSLDAPELRVLAEQMPEIYQAVVPAEFQQIAESGARADQVGALGQMQAIAREGLPVEDRLAAQEAGRAVTSTAAAAQEDALRRIAARGQLGSGDEIQAQLAGAQQGSNLARDLGSDLARQSALRRMSAIGQAGQMAGQLRAQDTSRAAQNAAIANRYAELFSSMKTQEAQDAAQSRQAAQNYNVGTRQQIGNANTANAYSTALENLNRQNALKNQQFGQQVTKTSGLSSAYNALAAYKDAMQQQKANAIVGAGESGGGIGDSLLGGII
jgi:hypothetical protein